MVTLALHMTERRRKNIPKKLDLTSCKLYAASASAGFCISKNSTTSGTVNPTAITPPQNLPNSNSAAFRTISLEVQQVTPQELKLCDIADDDPHLDIHSNFERALDRLEQNRHRSAKSRVATWLMASRSRTGSGSDDFEDTGTYDRNISLIRKHAFLGPVPQSPVDKKSGEQSGTGCTINTFDDLSTLKMSFMKHGTALKKSKMQCEDECYCDDEQDHDQKSPILKSCEKQKPCRQPDHPKKSPIFRTKSADHSKNAENPAIFTLPKKPNSNHSSGSRLSRVLTLCQLNRDVLPNYKDKKNLKKSYSNVETLNLNDLILKCVLADNLANKS